MVFVYFHRNSLSSHWSLSHLPFIIVFNVPQTTARSVLYGQDYQSFSFNHFWGVFDTFCCYLLFVDISGGWHLGFYKNLNFPLKRSHLSVQLESAGPRPWCHCGRMPTVALISGSTVHSTPVDGFWWLISTHQSSCVYFRLCEISQSNFFSCSGISFSSAAVVHTCRFRPLINTKVRKFWCIGQSRFLTRVSLIAGVLTFVAVWLVLTIFCFYCTREEIVLKSNICVLWFFTNNIFCVSVNPQRWLHLHLVMFVPFKGFLANPSLTSQRGICWTIYLP